MDKSLDNTLNVSQEIYVSSLITKFNTKVKSYTKIMDSLFSKMSKFMPFDVFTVDKKFHLRVIALGKQGIYVGDEAGRVYHMVDSSFCFFVTSHLMKITCLLFDFDRETIISTCEGKVIKVSSASGFRNVRAISNVPATVKCMALQSKSNILYTGDEEGFISAYNLDEGVCFLRLSTGEEFSPLWCMTLDSETATVYAGNASGSVIVFEMETPLLVRKLYSDVCIITSVALHKPEGYLFAATDSGRVDVWSTRSFQKLEEINTSKHPITRLLILPNKNVVLGSNLEGCIYMWDISTFSLIKNARTYKKNGLRDVMVTPDEELVYTVGWSAQVEVINITTSRIITRIFTSDLYEKEEYSLICNSVDQIFCLSSNEFVLVYDLHHRRQSAALSEQFRLPVQAKTVTVMIISNDRQTMYFGCGNGRVIVWNFKQKVLIDEFVHEHAVTALNLRVDEAYLYVADEVGTTHGWQLSSKKRTVNITDAEANSIKFIYSSQDGRYLVTGKADGTMQLRSLDQGIIVHEIPAKHGDDIVANCQSTDLNVIFTATQEGKILRWSVENAILLSRQIIYKEGLQIFNICCNADGNSIYYYGDDNKLRVHDDNFQLGQPAIKENVLDLIYISVSPDNDVLYMMDIEGNVQYIRLVPRVEGTFFVKNNDVILTSVAANTDNMYVGNQNGTIDVWSLTTNDLYIQLNIKSSRVNCLLMHPNGGILYSGHEDGALAIWDADQQLFIKELKRQQGAITALGFNSNNTLLFSAGKDLQLLIWDMRDMHVKHIIPLLFDVEQITISPKDKHLTLRLITGQVAIYALNGKNLGYIGNKTPTLRAIAHSNYGEKLYLAYEDTPIQIFDLSDMEPIGTLCQFDATVEHMRPSPDGNKMYVVTRNGILHVVDINNKQVIGGAQMFETFNCNEMVFDAKFERLFALGNSKVFMIKTQENLNRYEKLYLKKTRDNIDSFGAERDFITLLEFIRPYYNNSFLIKTYYHPMLICAMLNYQNAIQIIFVQNIATYPQNNDKNQLSPIVLSFKLRNYNIAQIILRSVIVHIESFNFSYKEMKELMKAKYLFTHKYLKDVMVHLRTFTDSLIKVPLLSRMDDSVRIEYDVNHFFAEQRFDRMTLPRDQYLKQESFDIDSALRTIKDRFNRKDMNVTIYRQLKRGPASDIMSLKSNLGKVMSKRKDDSSSNTNIIWRPTKFYRINGYYSFEEGTTDSIQFLKNYVDSPCNDFILSSWRHIIDYKWNKVVKFLIPPALIHLTHVVFYSLFLVRPSAFWLLLADGSLLCVLLLYELMSLMITGADHFKDFYNFLDFVIITGCGAILLLTRHYEYGENRTNIELLHYFQVVTLLIVFFRGITYLRLFSYFRHLIDMIIGVTYSSISLIIILCYSIVAFSVMFTIAIDNRPFTTYLRNNLFAVQSAIVDYNDNEDGFKLSILGWIVFAIMVIFIPIILVNFLIAKMSNKYSELESYEKVTSYREKAKLILEIEFFYRFKNRGKESRNYTFLAKDASGLNETDDYFEDKIEENLETLNSQIEEIKKNQLKGLKKSKGKHTDLTTHMNAILLENTNIKDNLVALKKETTELKYFVSDQANGQGTQIDSLNGKLSGLIGIAEYNKKVRAEQLKKIAELEQEVQVQLANIEALKVQKKK